MTVQEAPGTLDSDVQAVTVKFDVIRRAAAQKLGIAEDEITLQDIADLAGLSMKSIWRFKTGSTPALPSAVQLARALDLKVEDFIEPKDGGR